MFTNHMTKKIEMTKNEAKAAGKPNTAEYNTLLELMKTFPGYQIEVVKSAAKKVDRFKGLDYDYMKKYIEKHPKEIEMEMDDGEKETTPILEVFYELRGLDKDGKKIGMAAAASYGEIKMWFLNQYPEIEKLADNVTRIIEETRKARAAQKAIA